MPTFALWGRYFQERTSKAFGIRYLLVIANIIQVISIMSRGKIGFIKIVIKTVYYYDNAIFCPRGEEKILKDREEKREEKIDGGILKKLRFGPLPGCSYAPDTDNINRITADCQKAKTPLKSGVLNITGLYRIVDWRGRQDSNPRPKAP